MNVLILSAGTRVKVVQYFKEALRGKGRVIATDMSPLAPALYEANGFHIVPRMTDAGYLDVILDICKKEHVNGVLSLIDPELSLLAKHEDDFKAVGTTVVGSSYDLCEMSLDKMQMYGWLTTYGYSCARSWDRLDAFEDSLEAGEVCFPVFVKPVRGSASIAIKRVDDMETLELLWRHGEGLMVQELMGGTEVGADVYVDMLTGEVVSIFTKEKLRMRAGETDKAISIKSEELFSFIERFVNDAGYRGQIDIDLFDVNGSWCVSEVNPRFGGGYPFAHACGCDHMAMIINNLNACSNKRVLGNYEAGVYMSKWSEISVHGKICQLSSDNEESGVRV